jgi:hypothetical protein
MDFGLAFSFVFKDPDWFKKIALAALCSLIPVIGQIFLAGWMLDTMKRVIDNHPVPLPDLDLGGQIILGLKAIVVGLVYSLPLILVSMVFGGMTSLFASNANGNFDGIFVTLISICFAFFAGIYGILEAFVLTAAYGKMVERGSIADGLKIGEAFKVVRAAPGAFLIALLGGIVAGIIAPLGTIACGIGVLLTTTYSMAIMGHFYGQAYREAVKNMGLSSPVLPSEPVVIPPAS